MLVQNLTPRHPEDGSLIDFGKKGQPGYKAYNFKPNEKGHEVCEVTDKDHLRRLLSIPEHYTPYLPDDDDEGAGSGSGGGNEGGGNDGDGDGGNGAADALPLIDGMNKPSLLAWIVENAPDLDAKASTPVHGLRQQVKKYLREKAAAEKAAAEATEGERIAAAAAAARAGTK